MRRLRPTSLLVLLTLCVASLAHAVPVLPVVVVANYPHDASAFTQGLVWHAGRLYESTGLYGQSTLREVDLTSGRVLRRASLDRREFGEDVTVFGDRLLQLTWQNGRAYHWDLESFTQVERVRYRGEGWGLTHDGESLIMSDGTAVLRFVDPVTFVERRRVTVTALGEPVVQLNALQWIDGLVYANIWQTTRIAEIDPETGAVSAFFELSPLLSRLGVTVDVAVESPNGIAYDAEQRRLFVTGKLWPRLFEVKVERDGRRWP